ncbi:ATP-binding cassette domain-containing protein [Leucobacter coleopterorum]|uniref:ATP-binding cassette domain-containing protein n=1 Tax=Leucobacter coleopterorum TaxID=2714933 RepID=A0ABX6JVV6_9MICO|nr:ATP-binding cassette domain-containing protein [Leucobacter coleopterorum]QIM17708.1 ATP-binding cassette domain-containing protein [Leucobacter coleopterorum]
MTNNTTSAIQAVGLKKTFGDYAAVEEVSFLVPYGRVVGLLGPNGAGKTTTMRMLLGLAKPTAGTAFIQGRQYSDLNHPARSIGTVLDGGGMHPSRSARQHLRIAAAMSGIDRARVDQVLAEAGMAAAANRPIRGYSLGMRQRLALATALLGEPKILVLDEPANGLDPDGIRWLRNKLRAFAFEGGAVLVSSHLLAEIEQVADDAVVIAHGRVLAAGSLTDLTADYNGNLESFYLDLTANTTEVR